jgi:antitoxin component of MazEF toxin-antitoxin module
MERIIAKNIKKIQRWGNGYAIYITKEAKALGWDDKTYVSISAIKNGEEEKLEIKKIRV